MIARTLGARAIPGSWRGPALALLMMLALLLAQYHETAAGMVSIWLRSETFTHAFVVPPIVLWLVWRKRHLLRDLNPRPLHWMLLPMAGAALLWLVGALVAANSVTQLAFTAMLVLAVPLVLGGQVALALAFPLTFLFFAVPVGEFLTPLMMQWTADFTVRALRISGIPVYREGLQFVIPSGNWSVVEACSGIRYLVASFMVGSLFAYLNYRSNWRRLAFVAVSIALPILANWLRAYMIVMLGHLSDNKIATGVDHLVYGWVLFGIVILGMFFIGARWSEPELPYQPRPGPAAAAAASPASRAWSAALLAALLVLAPPALLQGMANRDTAGAPRLALPAILSGGWVAGDSPLTDWRPLFVEPSTETRQTYKAGSDAVGVHIAYYRDQTDKRKLVSSGNVLVKVDDHLWNALSSGTRNVATDAGDLPLRTTEILAAPVPGQPVRQRLQVWQLYWVGGRLTRSDVVAKLYSAWQQLSGQGDDSATLLVYAFEPVPGDATPLLESFMRANFGALDALLQATRRRR